MSITLLHDWSKCLICLLNAENMLQILYYTQHLQMISSHNMYVKQTYIYRKTMLEMRDIAPISRFTDPGRLIYIYLGWSFVCIFEDVFVNVIVLPSVHQLFLYAEVFFEIQHQFKRIDIDLLNFLEINKRDYEIHFVYKDKNRIYENTQICQRLIFYIFFYHWSV